MAKINKVLGVKRSRLMFPVFRRFVEIRQDTRPKVSLWRVGLACAAFLAATPGNAADEGAASPGAATASSDDMSGAEAVLVPGQEGAAHDVAITGQWMVRGKRVPDRLSAYFTIENRADATYLVQGVSSPSCAQLYGYHSDQEISSATRNLFSHLALPENQTLVFPPGGYHLMCDEAPGVTVADGSTVSVTFTFLGGAHKTVNFPVKAR
ncbi:copper chaperone PCu(A)C [Acetobacter nitrogenifigens]|nr:copper chaperone PCu(A)C [Acetobacter nitrogenifigens]